MSEAKGTMIKLTHMNWVTWKPRMEDIMLALLLLGTFVVTLTNSASDGVLSMDTVKNNMLNEETRRKVVGIDDGHGKALVVKGRDKNSGPRFSGTCHYGGEKGHIKRMCRKWKQDKKKGSYQDDEDNGFTATVLGELLTVQECLYVGDKGHDWFVDTGASCHVTSNLELFTTYEASDFGILKMGNRGWSKISGMGDICNETDRGYHMTLKDVRHVSDLRVNILFASALDRQVFHQYIGDGKWKLINGSLEVAGGGLCCSLYKTHSLVYKDDLSAMGDTSSGVWHQSDGHIRKKGVLEKMSQISFSNGCSDQEEDGQEFFTTGDMVMSCSIRGSCTLQPCNSASSQLGRTPGNGVAPVFLPHGLEGEIVGFSAHVFFLRC